jgi:CelD/BcsL family acetyltransferase involved in cellulose biosynthesis
VNSVNSDTNRYELVDSATGLDRLASDWRRLQETLQIWESPYYCWEFVEAASKSRPTEAVVMRRAGKVVGIWPFHRISSSLGLPIAGALNDYHGPLLAPNEEFPPRDFLAAAKLERFDFHSHFPIQNSLESFGYHRKLKRSWIDLRSGSAAYLAQLRKRSYRVSRHPQKTRKIDRELGQIRLDFQSTDPADLEWLLAMKRDKYRRTGCPDYFAPAWSVKLIQEIFQQRTSAFRGVCSILWAGQHRIAGHFGMQANGVLHYWLPVFNFPHARYSPGLELLLRIITENEKQDFHTIDFGYGEEDFKQTLATDWGDVLVGSLDQNPARFHWNSWLENARITIKNSNYRELARDLARTFLPNLGKPKIR